MIDVDQQDINHDLGLKINPITKIHMPNPFPETEL